MIDTDKKYKTRNGRPVRILCTDRDDKRCVVAIVTNEDNFQEVITYTADGRVCNTTDYPLDLIEVTPYDHLKVDDKIIVSDDGDVWVHRHFAKVLHGVVYTFSNGKTSWSTENDGGVLLPWKYVRDQDGIDLM